MTRLFFALVTAAALVLSMAPGATAHTGDQSYLYLDVTEEVNARFQLPIIDVEEHLDVVVPVDDGLMIINGPLAETLVQFTLDHVGLSQAGRDLVFDFTEVTVIPGLGYVEVSFGVPLTPDDLSEDVLVRLDPFFDENPDRDALLLVANDWNRGVIDNEAESLLRFTPDERTQSVAFGESSWTNNFKSSVELGLDHIKTGPDHLLFIAALLLPSVLVFRAAWKPAGGFNSSLWRVLKVMTMFTVAHSVTFTLAGLGLIPGGNSKLIESLIALSIGVAALHNLKPIVPEREWLIAFVFGLIHGLGFASLVSDLDVSRRTQLLSLVARNVGIEIAQVIVVLLVFPILFALRRTKYYMPVFRVVSIGLILASLGWLSERLFGLRRVTTPLLDEVLDFPRVLVFIVLGGVMSVAALGYEAQRDNLLEVEGATAHPLLVDSLASPDMNDGHARLVKDRQ